MHHFHFKSNHSQMLSPMLLITVNNPCCQLQQGLPTAEYHPNEELKHAQKPMTEN